MKKSIVVIIVIVLAMALSAATGCGGSQPNGTSLTLSPSGSPGGPSEESSTTSSYVGGTATITGPFEEPDYLDPQPVDLNAITNLSQASLSDAAKEVLARQSFVATVAPADEEPWKFWQVYESARYRGLPLLVTTDSVLNAYHGLFDTLLQRMEEQELYKQTEVMTEALYNAASEQWNAAADPAIQEEARLNMAYFAVANSLLKGAVAAPDLVADEVDAELVLIEAAEGAQKSPILGYTEDYSQYKPRGHYTRNEHLERYFKAMMWYGHTAFFINAREPDIPEELAVSLTRRAIMVSSSLVDSAKEAWAAVYEPTSFLVGHADDLLVDDMQKVINQVFGTAQPEPDVLADESKIAAVQAELNKLPAPKILSATVRAVGDTENRESNERSFRVMGQRYIPDSYAFQQLVWAHVGEAEPPEAKRDLPMGLDIMTVLGSDQAYRIEREEFGQDRYTNWQTQIEKVNKEFSERSADLWPVNLYTGWLESLQRVMTIPPDTAPDFMRSRAWARKSLNTALGSWTELRHDTILYAKQSVTAEGDGGEEPQSLGYVEPYPAFYAKIAGLATTLRKGLVDYGLIDPESTNKLETMIGLAKTLQSISEKELTGDELTLDERTTIAEYGHYLETIEQFSDSEEGRTLSPSPEKSPLVADVHTSYNTGTALEEATGYPLVLYAAFKLDGKLQLFAGASYSYYEFNVPLAERLTDEAWVEILDSGQEPARPAWTNEWIVEE